MRVFLSKNEITNIVRSLASSKATLEQSMSNGGVPEAYKHYTMEHMKEIGELLQKFQKTLL